MRTYLLVLALAAAPCLALSGAALVDCPSAEASVSLQLSLQQLTSFSDRVVVGSSVESFSKWEPREEGGQRIVTLHRIRLERSIVGDGPQELWIKTLGGKVGSIGQRVDGEAVLPKAQRVLLFLQKIDETTFFVVGLGQGVYHIERAANGMDLIRRSLSGGTVISRSPTEPSIIDRPLDEVASTIRTIKASHAQ
jgi:hypothetical protein